MKRFNTCSNCLLPFGCLQILLRFKFYQVMSSLFDSFSQSSLFADEELNCALLVLGLSYNILGAERSDQRNCCLCIWSSLISAQLWLSFNYNGWKLSFLWHYFADSACFWANFGGGASKRLYEFFGQVFIDCIKFGTFDFKWRWFRLSVHSAQLALITSWRLFSNKSYLLLNKTWLNFNFKFQLSIFPFWYYSGIYRSSRRLNCPALLCFRMAWFLFN